MSTKLVSNRTAALVLLLTAAVVAKGGPSNTPLVEFQLGRDIYFLTGAMVSVIKGFFEAIILRVLRGGAPLAPNYSWGWEIQIGMMRTLVRWGQDVLLRDNRFFETVRRVENTVLYPIYHIVKRIHPRVSVRHFTVGQMECDAWCANATKLDSFCDALQGKNNNNNQDKHNVVLYLHGGGFAAGGRFTYFDFAITLAEAMPDSIIVLVDYGLAPMHQFPAPIHHVTEVIDHVCTASPNIYFALAGDSAGGGLVASCILHLREENNPLWIARMTSAVMISPMLSQEHSDDVYQSNEAYDIIQSRLAHSTARNYCPCPDTGKSHPLASPICEQNLGTGLPPMLIHFGELEIFADNCITFGTRAMAQGADIQLRGFDSMVHCFQVFASGREESQVSIQEMAQFIQEKFNAAISAQ